jgi:hypothetical protein
MTACASCFFFLPLVVEKGQGRRDLATPTASRRQQFSPRLPGCTAAPTGRPAAVSVASLARGAAFRASYSMEQVR